MNKIFYKGYEFRSLLEAAKFLGVNYDTARARFNIWGEEHLDKVFKKRKGLPNEKPSTDPQGREFDNVSMMLRFYKIDSSMFYRRRKAGWTLKDALNPTPYVTRVSKRHVEDHLGHTFNTVKAMCDHYKISPQTFRARVKKNWSLEKSLTGKTTDFVGSRKACVDPNGEHFTSIHSMCKAWGVDTRLFYQRKKAGWSLDDALKIPSGESRIKNDKS